MHQKGLKGQLMVGKSQLLEIRLSIHAYLKISQTKNNLKPIEFEENGSQIIRSSWNSYPPYWMLCGFEVTPPTSPLYLCSCMADLIIKPQIVLPEMQNFRLERLWDWGLQNKGSASMIVYLMLWYLLYWSFSSTLNDLNLVEENSTSQIWMIDIEIYV